MRPRYYFLLGVLLLHPGCAFFGVERTDCLPDSDCSVSIGDGDGDLASSGGVGDGDGDTGGSGGGGYGDGDGDGDGDLLGGAPATGGRGGSGGEPTGGGGVELTGGSGGMPSGGSGGEPAGGSGGEPTGGSGGMPSGGTGGMGTGGIAQIARELWINEIDTQYVEIYFAADQATSFYLDGFRIVVDDDAQTACELTGGFVDESNPFFVAYRTSPSCTNCVVGCSFDSIEASTEVRLEMLIGESFEPIQTEMSWSTVLSSDESYQMDSDGSGDFVHRTPKTPGSTNN